MGNARRLRDCTYKPRKRASFVELSSRAVRVRIRKVLIHKVLLHNYMGYILEKRLVFFFFRFRSNFRAITRLEMLTTQAKKKRTGDDFYMT